ncbi:unnamed protein product [Prorocentrum cordatum]|uniref:Uncharacterized protein n=1 Tax=Prorocentrum cordatum TaxID=2364126 RepID=A0ABN9UHA4_9DINO|nr:unnamed protein product [Polarella glacialis]
MPLAWSAQKSPPRHGSPPLGAPAAASAPAKKQRVSFASTVRSKTFDVASQDPKLMSAEEQKMLSPLNSSVQTNEETGPAHPYNEDDSTQELRFPGLRDLCATPDHGGRRGSIWGLRPAHLPGGLGPPPLPGRQRPRGRAAVASPAARPREEPGAPPPAARPLAAAPPRTPVRAHGACRGGSDSEDSAPGAGEEQTDLTGKIMSLTGLVKADEEQADWSGFVGQPRAAGNGMGAQTPALSPASSSQVTGHIMSLTGLVRADEAEAHRAGLAEAHRRTGSAGGTGTGAWTPALSPAPSSQASPALPKKWDLYRTYQESGRGEFAGADGPSPSEALPAEPVAQGLGDAGCSAEHAQERRPPLASPERRSDDGGRRLSPPDTIDMRGFVSALDGRRGDATFEVLDEQSAIPEGRRSFQPSLPKHIGDPVPELRRVATPSRSPRSSRERDAAADAEGSRGRGQAARQALRQDPRASPPLGAGAPRAVAAVLLEPPRDDHERDVLGARVPELPTFSSKAGPRVAPDGLAEFSPLRGQSEFVPIQEPGASRRQADERPADAPQGPMHWDQFLSLCGISFPTEEVVAPRLVPKWRAALARTVLLSAADIDLIPIRGCADGHGDTAERQSTAALPGAVAGPNAQRVSTRHARAAGILPCAACSGSNRRASPDRPASPAWDATASTASPRREPAVGGKRQSRRAGERTGLGSGWLKLRREQPALFQKGVKVWLHPEATVDEVICIWLAEEVPEQTLIQVDSLAAERTQQVRQVHFLRQQVKHTIGPKQTSKLQLIDVRYAALGKKEQQAHAPALRTAMRQQARATGEAATMENRTAALLHLLNVMHAACVADADGPKEGVVKGLRMTGMLQALPCVHGGGLRLAGGPEWAEHPLGSSSRLGRDTVRLRLDALCLAGPVYPDWAKLKELRRKQRQAAEEDKVAQDLAAAEDGEPDWTNPAFSFSDVLSGYLAPAFSEGPEVDAGFLCLTDVGRGADLFLNRRQKRKEEKQHQAQVKRTETKTQRKALRQLVQGGGKEAALAALVPLSSKGRQAQAKKGASASAKAKAKRKAQRRREVAREVTRVVTAAREAALPALTAPGAELEQKRKGPPAKADLEKAGAVQAQAAQDAQAAAAALKRATATARAEAAKARAAAKGARDLAEQVQTDLGRWRTDDGPSEADLAAADRVLFEDDTAGAAPAEAAPAAGASAAPPGFLGGRPLPPPAGAAAEARPGSLTGPPQPPPQGPPPAETGAPGAAAAAPPGSLAGPPQPPPQSPRPVEGGAAGAPAADQAPAAGASAAPPGSLGGPPPPPPAGPPPGEGEPALRLGDKVRLTSDAHVPQSDWGDVVVSCLGTPGWARFRSERNGKGREVRARLSDVTRIAEVREYTWLSTAEMDLAGLEVLWRLTPPDLVWLPSQLVGFPVAEMLAAEGTVVAPIYANGHWTCLVLECGPQSTRAAAPPPGWGAAGPPRPGPPLRHLAGLCPDCRGTRCASCNDELFWAMEERQAREALVVAQMRKPVLAGCPDWVPTYYDTLRDESAACKAAAACAPALLGVQRGVPERANACRQAGTTCGYWVAHLCEERCRRCLGEGCRSFPFDLQLRTSRLAATRKRLGL